MKMLLLLAALCISACTTGPTPTPTPGGMDDAIANLVLRGITVRGLVSGDPGCPTSDLHDNAVHLEVSYGSLSSLRQIYLFQWRRASDFDAASAAFNDCVAEFSETAPGVNVSTVEASPWRAYGPNWTPELVTLPTRLVAQPAAYTPRKASRVRFPCSDAGGGCPWAPTWRRPSRTAPPRLRRRAIPSRQAQG
jgi:hypothetical protein